MRKIEIAAVIVFALFLIYFLFFGCMPFGLKICDYGPIYGDPNEEASSKIKTLLNTLGIPGKTMPVIFKKDSSVLRVGTIGVLVDAPYPDICLDTSPELKNLFDRENYILKYNGNSDIATKLLVICDNANQINETINNTIFSESFPNCTANESREISCFVSVIPIN